MGAPVGGVSLLSQQTYRASNGGIHFTTGRFTPAHEGEHSLPPLQPSYRVGLHPLGSTVPSISRHAAPTHHGCARGAGLPEVVVHRTPCFSLHSPASAGGPTLPLPPRARSRHALAGRVGKTADQTARCVATRAGRTVWSCHPSGSSPSRASKSHTRGPQVPPRKILVGRAGLEPATKGL